MDYRHPLFSSKLIVMLGKALTDLITDNGAELHDLIKAFDLVDFPEDMSFQEIEMEPEQYVQMVARYDDGRNVVALIEAIHKDVTTENAAVFTTTNKITAPGLVRSRPTVPRSFIGLIRELRNEGFAFRSYKLVPIDSEAPQEFKDKTELAARVRSHAELDPRTLIYHMDQSDSTMDNGDGKSAASAARHFFEGLVINISVCTAQLRKGVPPILPEKAQRPKFGKARADLHDISFTTDEEDVLIGAMYGFLSEEGGHYGITSPQMAKLSRRFCWVLADHLLTKYKSQSGAAE